MKTIQKLSNILDRITSILAGFLMSVLCLLTFLSVIWRFVLNDPIQWLYELSIVILVWLIFLGTTMAFKRKEHIYISYLIAKLPLKGQHIWQQFIYMLTLLFLFIIFKDGVYITKSLWYHRYNTIPLSKGVYYLSFTSCSVIAMVHTLNHMIRNQRKEGGSTWK